MPGYLKQVFNKYILLFIVFLTGGAVLILEVTATRILSIFFGNTIFTTSSVTCVMLLALSVGYLIGGRLADKRTSESIFYQMITLCGLSVFLLHLLHLYVLPKWNTHLTPSEGPFIVSLMLFFLPAFFLGTLPPIVANLQKLRLKKKGMGRIIGDVFFSLILGSLAGSLVCSFYLIPTFGINEIIIGTGLTLFLIGILGMAIPDRGTLAIRKLVVLFLALPLLQVTLVTLNDLRLAPPFIHTTDGLYNTIIIYDTDYYGARARFLQQAADSSSARYLDSDQLVYDYTKYYSLYKLVNPHPIHALVIGGGAYVIPKALLQDDPNVLVDVAEVEPSLLHLGQVYFDVPKTARLQNHVEDGRRFLVDSSTKYDVIFSDAFHATIPAHLTTKEFFALSKQRLTPEGLFIANITGSLQEKKPSFLFSEIRTFQSVYPNSYFFAVNSPTSPDLQNIIMVGYNADAGIDLLSVDSVDPILPEIFPNRINIKKYNLANHVIFTDNYAPVEYFLSQRLLQSQ
jgi:spermidine synthase